MTTYRTITAGETDSDSPIKTQLIVALEKNPRAILEGDASAPRILAAAVDGATIPGSALTDYTITTALLANSAIVEADLYSDSGAGGAVGQSQIKLAMGGAYTTTTLWNSTTGNGTAVVIPGGLYLLGWRTYASSGANYAFKVGYYPYRNNEMGTNFDQWITWFWHGIDPTATGTSYIVVYYVNASPPYRLPGDGPGKAGQDVRRFVFVDLDGAGKVISSAWLGDPPWFDPRAFPGLKHLDDGRQVCRRPALPCPWREALGNPARIAAYLEALKSGEGEEVELLPEHKCEASAMDARPHPWGRPAGTVRLLDPGHPLTEDLIDLMEAGAPLDELLANLRPVGDAPRGLRTPGQKPLLRMEWR